MSQQQRHPLRRIFLYVFLAGVIIFYSGKLIRSAISYYHLQSQKESFSGNSSDLKNTVILPTLDSPIQSNKNNIWCSSFQLAWNEMQDDVIREPVQINDALELCAKLNSAPQNKTDLLSESYYVAAGKISDGIAKKISYDMARRFPSKQALAFDSSRDGLIAYAYLMTYLKFTTPFLENYTPLIFTDSSDKQTPVKSFGIWDDSSSKNSLCSQVEVLYCKSEDDGVTEFALDLCKNTKPYQIVLALINPNETLESTYNHLQSEIKAFQELSGSKDTQFQEDDRLYVPDMFWKITHHFNELEGKSLTNTNMSGIPITTAAQTIQFRLDRTGVTLESYAIFITLGFESSPRSFIFDRPFLLYLKKRDASQPFLVMWVDNAELLTPY